MLPWRARRWWCDRCLTEHKPPHDVENLSRFTFAVSFVGALIFLYLRAFLLPVTPLCGDFGSLREGPIDSRGPCLLQGADT